MLVSLAGGPIELAAEHGLIRPAALGAVLDVAEAALRWRQHDEARRAQLDAECAALLDAAREQARQLREQALAEIESWQAQAKQQIEASREDARMTGYEDGHAEAVAVWHARQAEQARSLQAELRSAQAPLARVVCDAVAAIVRSADPQALYRRALDEVQSGCRGATRMRLHVSADDEDAAGRALAEWPAGGMQVELVVHADLAAGSCVAETDVGYVDASLELQLAALRDAMDRATAGFGTPAGADRDGA